MEKDKDGFISNKVLHKTFDFLPQLIRLMESVKDGEDGAKGEIGATADELYQNFDKALGTMSGLPGVDMSLEEQQRQLQELQATLQHKTDLVKNYRSSLPTSNLSISAKERELAAEAEAEAEAEGEADEKAKEDKMEE